MLPHVLAVESRPVSAALLTWQDARVTKSLESAWPEARRGVLLVNLGSPDEPSTSAVRAYLDEFLSDPFVVDSQPQLWWMLRKLVILPFRGPKSARLYQSIWTAEGSPLVVGSARLCEALQREVGEAVSVRLAMRYGKPSLEQVLHGFTDEGVDVIQVLPLFPQGSRTTTGTIEARVRELHRHIADAPALEFTSAYPTHPGYIEALAQGIREHLGSNPCDHYLFSFHGLPIRYVEQGDVYRDHCEQTAAALAQSLGLAPGSWTLTYQSRFGREPWLAPNTEDVAGELCSAGQRVAIACPGFLVDCLETLEEIGVRLAKSVAEGGAGEIELVPALNQRPDWVRALAQLVRGR